jgi:hypothetical protein
MPSIGDHLLYPSRWRNIQDDVEEPSLQLRQGATSPAIAARCRYLRHGARLHDAALTILPVEQDATARAVDDRSRLEHFPVWRNRKGLT